MGSHGEGAKRKKALDLQAVIRLVMLALVVAAVVKELRLPPDQRTWNGKLGFVPYELRIPTVERFKERIWNPDSPTLVGPKVFGVGWTLNIGRVVELGRPKVTTAA
jgi:hypothetical protein